MPIDETTELYKRYRPRTFKQVIGQEEVVGQLKNWLAKDKVPHTILFSGPSGTGKTTLARILANKLGIDNNDADLRELNAASKNGIEQIRYIESKMRAAPMIGNAKAWIIDEAHMLTSQAQQACLKPLEDTHKHVYFMLCTTEPGKIISTIHTRSNHLKLKLLKPVHIDELLSYVAKKEKFELPEEVADKIINMASGAARKALVLMHQVIELKSEQDMLDALVPEESEKKAGDLWGLLVRKGKWEQRWPAISDVLNSIDEEPETIRRIILAIASKVIRTNKKLAPKAYLIINAFRDPYYDSGKAGLDSSCWEVVSP